MRKLLHRLFHRHVWVSDLPLSLDGAFAVVSSLWMPSATCRCGKKCPGVNAPRPEWVDEQNGKRWRLSV